MRRCALVVYLAFILSNAHAQCTTRLINFGNDNVTNPSGINKYDTVVGWYLTYTSPIDLLLKGFHWFRGQTISTSATNQYYGINDLGDVVGDNRNGAFVAYQGKGYVINYPGSFYTEPNGINNHGMIVGIYIDPNFVRHGFYHDRSGFHSFDIPNSGLLTVRGINDAGVIVGTADTRGYVYYQGQIRYISYPGAEVTKVEGINNYGTIVGEFAIHSGEWMKAFKLRGTNFTTYSYPNSLETRFTAVNNLGDVAGTVVFSDSEHPKGLFRSCR